MCRNVHLFDSLKAVLASGENVFAEVVGVIKIKSSFTCVILKKVLFVPSLHSNFIPIGTIVEAGHGVTFLRDKAIVRNKHGIFLMEIFLMHFAVQI